MTFKMPLSVRLRLANDKRRRYWSNPDERLLRINKSRVTQGLPVVESLDEIETRGPRCR